VSCGSILTSGSDVCSYKYVVFVDASSSSSIQADLQVWAQALGDGHERDVWEDSLRILSSGSSSEQSALVLDNADEPTLDITPFFPKSKGVTVIITSRNRNLGGLSTTYHLELGEMRKDEALSTLLRAARRNIPLPAEELKSAQALVNELGSLAVALVHAGAYCYEMSSTQHGVLQPYTFTQYLSLFHSHRAGLMRNPAPASLDRYQKGVYTTLDISYAALPQVAREFLHFISFFHHTDIPLAAIAANADQGFQDILSYFPRPESYSKVISDLKQLLCMDDKWNELKVHEIIRTLRSFSLVSTTSIDDNLFLQLHPLTQAWSKDMVDSGSPNYNAMVVCALTSASNRDNIHLYRYILPHITGMLDRHEVHHLHINDLMAAGRLFNEQGQFLIASRFIEAALELVAEYTETQRLDIIADLAVAYDGEGRWGEAEELKLGVLEGRRRSLGDNNLYTIKAAAHLAATYQLQGRWKEAEKLGEAVLEWRARSLGNEHNFTIDAAASLAITYYEQGMLNYAEMLEVGVLTLYRKHFGRDHTESIMAAAQLATTYYDQFRFKEAEKLQVEVLEKRKKILGVEHPETIKTAANLANTYGAQGRLSEAEVLLVDALELLRRTRGPEHSETILAESNLGLVYFHLGRREEATTLIESAVRLSLKVMGAKHPSTQRHLKVIVMIYEQLGRLADAQEKRALLIS
jgi:tetratricopeptide (TPR) repeat protein